jgi:hypothetical protein
VTLNYVELTLNVLDATGSPVSNGTAVLSPTQQLLAPEGVIVPAPVSVPFNGLGSPAVKLLTNDNPDLTSEDWAWFIQFVGIPNSVPFAFQLLSSGGESQLLSEVAQVPITGNGPFQPVIPWPSGSPSVGEVPVYEGPGSITWGNPGAGSYLSLSGGTMLGWFAPDVVTLADAASVPINAAAGNVFEWSLGGNHTLQLPTNPTVGQAIIVDILYEGSFVPSFAAGYSFGTDGQPAWTSVTGRVDKVGFRYSGLLSEWLCEGWKLGFT